MACEAQQTALNSAIANEAANLAAWSAAQALAAVAAAQAAVDAATSQLSAANAQQKQIAAMGAMAAYNMSVTTKLNAQQALTQCQNPPPMPRP